MRECQYRVDATFGARIGLDVTDFRAALYNARGQAEQQAGLEGKLCPQWELGEPLVPWPEYRDAYLRTASEIVANRKPSQREAFAIDQLDITVQQYRTGAFDVRDAMAKSVQVWAHTRWGLRLCWVLDVLDDDTAQAQWNRSQFTITRRQDGWHDCAGLPMAQPAPAELEASP
jgi:hypothetical protein